MNYQEFIQLASDVASNALQDLGARIESDDFERITLVLSHAVPRTGCQHAARITFIYRLNKKSTPLTLWSGIVSERTFVRLHDARRGIFGFLNLGWAKEMRHA